MLSWVEGDPAPIWHVLSFAQEVLNRPAGTVAYRTWPCAWSDAGWLIPLCWFGC